MQTKNLKRAKPLMIDSHAVASFSDALNYNDENSNETEGSSGNETHNNNNGKMKSFVELEDDGSNSDELVMSPQPANQYTNNNQNNNMNQIGVINKNELYSNCVDVVDTEIETINNIKSKSNVVESTANNNNNNNANKNNKLPTVKRLKTSDFQFMNGTKSHLIRNGNFQNYQIVNNQKAILVNNNNNNGNNMNQESVETLNEQDLFGPVQSSGGGGGLMDSMGLKFETGGEPIVSMPDSPSINSMGLNNSNRLTLINDEPNRSTESNNENTIISENAHLKRAISSFKSSNITNNIHDHNESLQIDLNSIKEFLTNSTFNQPDTYNTINNLFSPSNSMILDQMDEPCFDPHPQYSTNTQTLVNNNNANFIQNDLTNSMISNGKVIDFNQIQK